MLKMFSFLRYLCACRDCEAKYLRRECLRSIVNRVTETYELRLVQLGSLWFFCAQHPSFVLCGSLVAFQLLTQWDGRFYSVPWPTVVAVLTNS